MRGRRAREGVGVGGLGGENKRGAGHEGAEKSKNDVTKGTKIRKKMTSREVAKIKK